MAQAGIHRPDRSPPVRILALQGDYFRDGRSEIFPFLEDYSRQKGLQFRHGLYTGSGWDVDDYARVMQQGGEDFGQQLSSYMVRAGSRFNLLLSRRLCELQRPRCKPCTHGLGFSDSPCATFLTRCTSPTWTRSVT